MTVSTLENNFPVLLDDDVRIEMTAKEIRIIGEKFSKTLALDDMSGIVGAIPDGYGIAIGDDYYQIKAYRPIWNEKQRFIRKILRGESIGRDSEGEIV